MALSLRVHAHGAEGDERAPAQTPLGRSAGAGADRPKRAVVSIISFNAD